MQNMRRKAYTKQLLIIPKINRANVDNFVFSEF